MVKEDVAEHTILEDDSWRGMKKCCPIVFGGLNPVKLKPFIDLIESMDFITTMGAGCNAHPGGTRAGSTALVQSMEAFKKGVSIEEYAKDQRRISTSD